VLSSVGTASARTWNVDDDDGRADFSGIQEAINNASMGDTIIVHSGVYYEKVYVTVTLKGIGYPVVAANGSGSAITLNADGITLDGFNATNSGSLWECAGINVISSNNSIYINNFINNTDNVYSCASTNIWNSPEEITYTYNGTTYESYLGNYWDDYEGRADAKGIGDTPYSIDPEKDECDVYPLTTPFENYISSESDTGLASTSNMETIAKTFVTFLNESERTSLYGRARHW
jgi:nitrous oxidase accessory protein NosD